MTTQSNLIHVGELAVGFSENCLSPTLDLADKTYIVYFEDQSTGQYRFRDERNLEIVIQSKSSESHTCQVFYVATNPRKDVYFVDYIRQDLRATTECLVIDLKEEIVTLLTGTLPTESETRYNRLDRVESGLPETAVDAWFLHGAIDKPFLSSTPRHQPTSELIGKRVKYTYSSKDAYEHIYLNQNLYTWHCLSGVEKGLADTDFCHYFKIREELYFFIWREKLVPTLGVVVVDLRSMKTTGKIFGYESGDFGALTNFPIGAYAQLGSITRYES